ncbi:MAG: hypothetical protein K2X35_08410 [Bryobacteraceae bacterium]|nr:hypothetical protein [Bryobacteraceae bacterium]
MMSRSDIYLKVEVEFDSGEPADKLAQEVCRALLKLYGVRAAEVQNIIAREPV